MRERARRKAGGAETPGRAPKPQEKLGVNTGRACSSAACVCDPGSCVFLSLLQRQRERTHPWRRLQSSHKCTQVCNLEADQALHQVCQATLGLGIAVPNSHRPKRTASAAAFGRGVYSVTLSH